MSTSDIIKKIFDLHGLSGQLEARLSQTYAKRPYCVQYGESDQHFLQRLMEDDGIYYFFEYDGKKHTMILADDLSAHKSPDGYDSIVYRSQLHPGTDECLTDYRESRDLGTSVVALNDYDFEKPRSPLLVQQKSPGRDTKLEWFEFPGGYNALDDGHRLARIRVESKDAASRCVRFQGTAGTSYRKLVHSRGTPKRRNQ